MSIHDLRKRGLKDITMRYEDGGKMEVYKYKDKEINFEPGASIEQVVAAFKDEK